MSFVKQILPFVVNGTLLLHLSSSLLLLVQVLLEPVIEISLAFLARLKAIAVFAVVSFVV